MNERQSDFELLQRFTRQGDQPAFADLVRRHVNLVYATALRKLEDPGAAEEVAQNVFSALVKKGWQFAPDDSLPAWLYQSALLESKHWLRGELRRRKREQIAAQLCTTMKTPDEQPAFGALLPLLDEALLSLREKDRTALLLRFYENQSLREIGHALGVSDDTAQKRVAAALEKVSAFFRRRGFRTASVAATAAALEYTAASAPAIVANSVVLASAKVGIPAMGGLMAVVARLASLTKAQTAALCLAVAALPAGWQYNQLAHARKEVVLLETRVSTTRTELSTTHSEIDRLTERSNRLAVLAATTKETAEQRAAAAKRLAEWKDRLARWLVAADYRWPADSPLVRIPKRALTRLSPDRPVRPPGVLEQSARELLGLTPQERERIEGILRDHFDNVDILLAARTYETNQPSYFRIPASATASAVWVLPAVGQELKTHGDEMLAALEQSLGPERWPLVQKLLEPNGLGTLRWVLNLDAAKQPQEIGAWLRNENRRFLVDYGFSKGSDSMTSGGLALDLFRPGNHPELALVIHESPLTDSLQRRMTAWLQQQAETYLAKESSK